METRGNLEPQSTLKPQPPQSVSTELLLTMTPSRRASYINLSLSSTTRTRPRPKPGVMNATLPVPDRRGVLPSLVAAARIPLALPCLAARLMPALPQSQPYTRKWWACSPLSRQKVFHEVPPTPNSDEVWTWQERHTTKGSLPRAATSIVQFHTSMCDSPGDRCK